MQVGDYTLLEALEGHEREVHRAQNASGVRAIVAMFELSEDAARGVREDYERAKALDHEAIAAAVDLFENDGKLAMVFEGIAGVSASQVLEYLDERWEHLSDGAALKIGLSLCEALHAAHTAKDATGKFTPLVHAQLGPHQIFLTFDGSVRLLGLGLGTAFRTAAGRGDIPEEAVPYQAPEVLRGGPLTVVANVYSAAAVLWRLLSHRPLPSKGHAFPPLSAARRDLPAVLTKAIDAALEPSMLKRRMTCVQLVRAIERTGLADAKDLRWNLEILEEQVEFANSTIGALSFPPAQLSDVPMDSIQPVSSSFPAPDSDGPTNVVAVPPLASPRLPSVERAAVAGQLRAPARDDEDDDIEEPPVSGRRPSLATEPTDPPDTPVSPGVPGFLDDVPMPHETAAMAEVRLRIERVSRHERSSTPHGETEEAPATGEPEGPISEELETLRPAALVQRATAAAPARPPRAPTVPQPVTSSSSLDSDDWLPGIVLTPGRWLTAVIAVAGLCGLFLIIGILIGRASGAPDETRSETASPETTSSPAPLGLEAPETRPRVPDAAPGPNDRTAEKEPTEKGLPPLGSGQGHLLVKTQQAGAHVYVAGRPAGLPGEVLVVPCGVRNVRIGTLPLARWLSPSRAFNLVCGRRTTLWLETNRAVQVKEP